MSAWIADGNEFAAPFQPMGIGKEPFHRVKGAGQHDSAANRWTRSVRMSTQSKKSTSWFARLGSCTWAAKRRGASSGQNRRGLRFESLETRSLLSATVLPTISGIVYEDPTGSGVTSNDLRWPMSRSTSGATAATASSRARVPAATTRWSARPPATPTASTSSTTSPPAPTSFRRIPCRDW